MCRDYFDSTKFDFSIIDKLVENYNNKVSFSPGKTPYITLKSSNSNIDLEQINEIKAFLNFLNK